MAVGHGRHARHDGLATSVSRRVRRNIPLALLDLAVVLPAYLGPLVLRFDGRVPDQYWTSFWLFIPVVGLIHLTANHIYGLYGQMWRYASVQEARRVAIAALVGGGFVIGVNAAIGWMWEQPMPRSVVIMGSVLSLIGFGAIRFHSRLFGLRRRSVSEHPRHRVLLVGAGAAGSMVLKDILENPSVGLEPVCFVDDDPRKIGLALHEVPVLGDRSAIPALVERLDVEEVLLAIPSATGEQVREVAAVCEEANVTLRVLPTVREVVDGKISAKDIRDLQIEDLLGRQQVTTDLESVAATLRGRRVLVTGAGGSIGSEITRQIAEFEPASIIVLDHDETHLHEVVLQVDDGTVVVEQVLADVRDRDRIFGVFMHHRPEIVFHAAAHKHVPVLERFPEEAVLTNVIGTANVADAAVAAGVTRFILISTDKAVRPVSVMGATKWFAEQIVRSIHGMDCVFCAVRFGNVLGSRGSVIPTFLEQIRRGGPVTVTAPDMARYFMSVQESVQLVLQAAALSEGGEVFTLEMGEPVNIMGLARKLILLSGRVPGRDVEIEFVGARPGERLIEELVNPDEHPVATTHPGIVMSRPPVPDRPSLRGALRELEALSTAGERAQLAARIKSFAEDFPRTAVVVP